MAVTSASLFSETGGQRLENGVIVFWVTRTYQASTNSDSDGPLVVTGSSQIPQVGATASTPGGVDVYVVSSNADRKKGVSSKREWWVTVEYTSRTGNQEDRLPVNPSGLHITNPTEAAQEVELVYTTEYAPVSDGKYVRAKRLNASTGTFTTVADPPGIDTNYTGPIISSNGEPRSEAKRRKSILTLRVSRVVSSWPASWDAIIDKKNNAAMTITESDNTGAKFERNYGAGDLLLLTIQKKSLWLAKRLYYRATFVLLVDEDNQHVYSHPDYGTYRRLFVDQYKNNRNQPTKQWNPAQIYAQETLYPRIFHEGEPLTEPVKLNGWGQNMPFERDSAYSDNDTFFLDYDIVESASFGPLGIT